MKHLGFTEFELAAIRELCGALKFSGLSQGENQVSVESIEEEDDTVLFRYGYSIQAVWADSETPSLGGAKPLRVRRFMLSGTAHVAATRTEPDDAYEVEVGAFDSWSDAIKRILAEESSNAVDSILEGVYWRLEAASGLGLKNLDE